jgi:hypothetical protein
VATVAAMVRAIAAMAIAEVKIVVVVQSIVTTRVQALVRV